MQKDDRPPVLPTIDTPGVTFAESAHSPPSPRQATSTALHTQKGPQLRAQSSVRRHQRKRSSTIFVQARPAPAAQVEEAPLAPGLLRGVTSLAGAQLLAKLLAFVLNQLLIKFSGARDLGVASQLDLLVGTALALGRDALRLASQRQTATRLNHKSEYTTDGRAVLGTLVGACQETINLGWTAALVGTTLVIGISGALQLRDSWPASAISVAAFAAIIELMSEPCYLLIQLKLRLEKRARAESLASVVRVSTVAIALLIFHLSPFIGFAIGHLSYAMTLAAMYYGSTSKAARDDGFSLLPQKVWTSQGQLEAVYISGPLRRTALELYAQQVVKFFLTEGDKLAVGFMTALEEQGEYALAANYGSLLARLLFQPVEEALRGYFTRVFPKQSSPLDPRADPLLSPASSPTTAAQPFSQASSTDKSQNSSSAAMDSAISSDKITVLASVLRAYSYVGILAFGFGPLIAKYLISFVVSSARFGHAADVLAVYACYIPVMAWNGALEALVQSVASLRVLRSQGAMLAGNAVFFLVLTYLFVSFGKMGAVGIVWAQIVSMSLRMLWNLHFATVYFGRGFTWLRNCLPKWWIGLVASVSIGVSRHFIGPVSTLKQFSLVSALASSIFVAALISEFPTLVSLKATLKKAATSTPKLKAD